MFTVHLFIYVAAQDLSFGEYMDQKKCCINKLKQMLKKHLIKIEKLMKLLGNL